MQQFGITAAVVLIGGCAAAPEDPAPSNTGGNAIESRPFATTENRPAPANTTPAGNSTSAGDGSTVVARVEGVKITREQLVRPLIEAHGLPMLLNLVQLEMARQQASTAGITVSQADVIAEQDRTLKRMFEDAGTRVVGPGGETTPGDKVDPSEYQALLDQFLQRRNMSRGEWDLLMHINATLRKIVEPKARGRLTDDQVNEAFRQMYGEKVQVHHIQGANLQEIAEAKRRLAAGESFDDVARAVSRNARTAPLGGELPPFTRQSAFPQAFKDAAFALQPGQVSDPVMADNAYHLIKLIRKIEPTVIKFEDVKDSIREDLEENLVQQGMQDLRNDRSIRAQRSLQITDKTLKAQFDEENLKRERQIRDRSEIRKELERERERAATQQAIPDLPPAPAEHAPPAPHATKPATQPG
jgi:hypothetical protein